MHINQLLYFFSIYIYLPRNVRFYIQYLQYFYKYWYYLIEMTFSYYFVPENIYLLILYIVKLRHSIKSL